MASEMFLCDESAPGRARTFCAAQLTHAFTAATHATRTVETSQLIVSELVTNAVNAGSTRVELSLYIDDDLLRIRVFDDAPGLPRLVDSGPDDDHGRGLRIVAALASRWGTEPAGNIKQTWAELALVRVDP